MATKCCFSSLSPPPQYFHGGLDEDVDGTGPLDDEGRNIHLVLPASVVEGLVVVAGGKEDGDQVLLSLSLQRERR